MVFLVLGFLFSFSLLHFLLPLFSLFYLFPDICIFYTPGGHRIIMRPASLGHDPTKWI